MPDNVVGGAVDGLANSRGRSMRQIAVSLGLTAGAVALSALAARLFPPSDTREAYSDYEEPEAPPPGPQSLLFAMAWPPLFMALILSALRIWEAPRNARPG